MENPGNNTYPRWNHKNEIQAILLHDKASYYRYLHYNNKMSFCEFLLDARNIDILSNFINTTIFIILGTTSCENKTVLILIASAINMINIIINTYNKIIINTNISERDRISSISWGTLARTIRLELSLPEKYRKEEAVCLETWKNEYDKLAENSPLIKNSTINKFTESLKIQDTNKPDSNNISKYFRLKIKVTEQLDANTNIMIPYKQFINDLIKENSDEDNNVSNL